MIIDADIDAITPPAAASTLRDIDDATATYRITYMLPRRVDLSYAIRFCLATFRFCR